MGIMSVFISDRNFDADFWKFQTHSQHIEQIHKQQKISIQTCQDFLKNINSEQTGLIYQKIAKVWSKLTGGEVGSDPLEFGKLMVCHHLDDPIVHRTIIDFKDGTDFSANLEPATCQTTENVIRIKGSDVFETECAIILPPNPTAQTLSRIFAAFRALNYAARRMPFSPNKLTENNCPVYLKGLIHQISSRTEELQDNGTKSSLPEKLVFQKREYPNPFVKSLAKAKFDKKRGVTGNCFDLSTCAFNYFLNEKFSDKVDLYGIKNGNHAFLVMGKDEKCFSDDHTTWNLDAIVCDIWDRTIFPVSLIPTHLTEFTSQKTQSLSLTNSNFFNSDDFHSKSSSLVPEVEQLLLDFHTLPTAERSKRYDIASKIVEVIDNLPFAHAELVENDALSSLLSQMRHFLELSGSAFERVKNKFWLFNSEALSTGEILESNTFFRALESVALSGDSEWFHHCIEAGASPKNCSFYQSTSDTPECVAFEHAFEIAERTDNPNIIRLAVKGGALPNEYAIERALYLSKKKENFDFFQAVIEARAKPGENTFYHAAIIAAKIGKIDHLSQLVKIGARSNKTDGSYRETLHASLRTGNLDFLRLALEAGAQLSMSDLTASCEMALATENLFFIEALLIAEPDAKALIRYNLKRCAEGYNFSSEFRQILIDLVGVRGRDFFC